MIPYGGYRIMVIMSAFQAEDGGSIPLTRSKKNALILRHFLITPKLESKLVDKNIII